MWKKKYVLTPEHEAQLGLWRDRWIQNAFSTKPLTLEDPERIRRAVRGLYEAANLTPPPDDRIVIVPSPTVALFAGGFAAAIWFLHHKKNAAGAAISNTTEAAAATATEAALAATDGSTDATTVAVIAAATEAAISPMTSVTTWAATRAIIPAWMTTRMAVNAATREMTWKATAAATWAATGAATGAATEAVTWAATWAATGAVTGAATEAVTWAATSVATGAATEAVTRAATGAATGAATEAVTRAAAWAATGETATTGMASHDTWYRIPTDVLCTLARTIFGNQKTAIFALKCANNICNSMWDGGNQWSGWVAYLTFFRHIAKLQLDYSKWTHYEVLAEYGPRVMHPDFCLVSERPTVLTVDAQNRPHNETGPFCEWRDGTAAYAVHGVHVPQWFVDEPERLTLAHIQQESNAEVRRLMLEKFGFDRYITETGALPIQADDYGTLYRCDLNMPWRWIDPSRIGGQPMSDEAIIPIAGADHNNLPIGEMPQSRRDEPLVLVRLTNATSEAGQAPGLIERNGAWHKTYMLRVPPTITTAREAVAWSFNLTTQEYAPDRET